ncbi:MAG: hypothetical protein JNK21_04225 [Rhodospirillaceae bacterium]|nr:hypothetical protein [Rhodospirillaceae bacterium]
MRQIEEFSQDKPARTGPVKGARFSPETLPEAPKMRRSVPPELAYAVGLERLYWTMQIKGLRPDQASVLPRAQRLAVRLHKSVFAPGASQSMLQKEAQKDLSLKQALLQLEAQHKPHLMPTDADTRKRALALERWLTSEVSDTLVWCLLRPPVAVNAATRSTVHPEGYSDQFMTAVIMRALDVVQSLSAQQTYLFGNTLTHADLSAAAVLAPVVRKQGWHWAGKMWAPLSAIAGRSALARHPAANWVRMMYDLHAPAVLQTPDQTRAWVP